MLTHNRPRLLRQALVTLYANTPHDAFTLVIADDNSTDPSAICLLDKAPAHHNCIVLRAPDDSHVLARAKNAGVAKSREIFVQGNYLLLCDNDVAFLPGWHTSMTRTLATNPRLAVVGGQQHPYHQFSDKFWSYGITDAVAGTSQLMHRAIWNSFGPLEGNAPGVCQSEDFAFCQKITKDARDFHVGYMLEPCILDCGITQTDGKPSPGADVKPRVAGILYE